MSLVVIQSIEMSACMLFKCRSCAFRFLSGWSHHERGMGLICKHCGEQFKAVSEQSPWGPQPDERLPVFHLRHVSKRKGSVTVPTGSFLLVEKSSKTIRIGNRSVPQVQVTPSSLTCPHCGSQGTVTETLYEGQSCPKCHTGFISDEGEVEY